MADTSADNNSLSSGKQGPYGENLIAGHSMSTGGDMSNNPNYNNQGKVIWQYYFVYRP